MENVEVLETTAAPIDETIGKKLNDDSECEVQAAVDIVDHYAMKCDPKSNEFSDSTHPMRPPRKYSEYSIDSAPSSRKSSECMESSPIKPSRKLSQSSTNRKFSTTSDTSSIRTPKKVSFSDELPLAAIQLGGGMSTDNATQISSEYLNRLTHAMMDSGGLESIQHSSDGDESEEDTDHYSSTSPSSSISTQTMNELTKADMFPNSRKVSLHSERSFDMTPSSILKPGTESATTQITTESENANAPPMETFLDNERRMSTGSIKCKFLLRAFLGWFYFIFLIFDNLLFSCSRKNQSKRSVQSSKRELLHRQR